MKDMSLKAGMISQALEYTDAIKDNERLVMSSFVLLTTSWMYSFSSRHNSICQVDSFQASVCIWWVTMTHSVAWSWTRVQAKHEARRINSSLSHLFGRHLQGCTGNWSDNATLMTYICDYEHNLWVYTDCSTRGQKINSLLCVLQINFGWMHVIQCF